MHIVLVGLNHKTAPVEVRERLAFRAEQLPAAYGRLRQDAGLSEALILSTCNRVEIYAGVTRLDGTFERVAAFLSRHGGVDGDALHPRLYQYADPRSIEHLFVVASGLDSMVLGETDILHQVKHSYELAKRHGTTGKALNVLFQRALNAGKAVQARTAVGHGCLSVGTVAIELAQKIFGDLKPYSVLLVGAGKIGELVLRRLRERGVSRIRIANRSLDRARQLAAAYGASAQGLEDLGRQLVDADIAVTSSAAPGFLISKADVTAVMGARRNRPLCLIDLGVPRNIDPAIGQLENVYLFDIDDLQGLMTHHQTKRQQATIESHAIVNQKLQHFLERWHRELALCAPSSSELAQAP